VAKNKSAVRNSDTKLKHEPGGNKLSERIASLWDNWDEATLETLRNKGMPDADLLPLIGASTNPNGSEIGKAFLLAFADARGGLANVAKLLNATGVKDAERQQIVREIRKYGLASERTGRLGGQYEMLAAEQMFQTNKARRAGDSRIESSTKARRLAAIEPYVIAAWRPSVPGWLSARALANHAMT
jgi:hypothetical protein